MLSFVTFLVVFASSTCFCTQNVVKRDDNNNKRLLKRSSVKVKSESESKKENLEVTSNELAGNGKQ